MKGTTTALIVIGGIMGILVVLFIFRGTIMQMTPNAQQSVGIAQVSAPKSQNQFYAGYQQLVNGTYVNPTIAAVYGNPNTGIIVTSAKQGQTFTSSNTIPISGGTSVTQVAHTFNQLLNPSSGI